MRTNRLGSSPLHISEIGLGCMSLGTDEARAIPIIRQALDLGVNFLDTADLYDAGSNEEIVGKAIAGRRTGVVLATKVGNRRVPGQSGWTWDPSKAYIKAAVKDSLRRLQTDYIDLYQLHGGTLEDPIDETIEAFEELKREGWIVAYGISSIRPNVIREYASRARIVSVMSQYSIVDRRPEEAVLPLLERKGIGLIARGPVAKGILSARGMDKLEQGAPEYGKEDLASLLAKLQPLVRPNRSLAQTALLYALKHPATATVIPGASSPEQLLHNIEAAASEPLTDDEYRYIQEVSKPNRYTAHT